MACTRGSVFEAAAPLSLHQLTAVAVCFSDLPQRFYLDDLTAFTLLRYYISNADAYGPTRLERALESQLDGIKTGGDNEEPPADMNILGA